MILTLMTLLRSIHARKRSTEKRGAFSGNGWNRECLFRKLCGNHQRWISPDSRGARVRTG